MKTYVKECRHGKYLLLQGDMISDYMNVYGEWSQTEVELFQALLSADANVVEVGANIGAHSIALSRICSGGRVFCYEPQRPIFHILCGNVALNDRLNVQVRHMAVGDRCGRIAIATSSYDQPWNYGSFSVEGGFNVEGKYASATTLDHVDIVALDQDPVLRDLACIDLLKIDAEGFEPNVLAGARELIGRHRPYVFAEANNAAVVDTIIAEMATHDYVGHWFATYRFRNDNYNGSTKGNAACDTNIIFSPRDRGFPWRDTLRQVTAFGDVANGIPILARYG